MPKFKNCLNIVYTHNFYAIGAKISTTGPFTCNLNIHGFGMGISHARAHKFFSEGSNFDNIFFVCVFIVNEGREGPNTTISKPSLVLQRNAI